MAAADDTTPQALPSTYEWTRTALDKLPLWTLVQTFHPVAAMLYALFARHGLTATQFGVLAQLASGAVQSQAELARRVLITPQSLHVVVAELHTRDLLEVSGSRGRGRRQRLTLTTAGWQLVDRVRPELEELNAPDGLGLGQVEARKLNSLLHRLRSHLHETDC